MELTFTNLLAIVGAATLVLMGIYFLWRWTGWMSAGSAARANRTEELARAQAVREEDDRRWREYRERDAANFRARLAALKGGHCPACGRNGAPDRRTYNLDIGYTRGWYWRYTCPDCRFELPEEVAFDTDQVAA